MIEAIDILHIDQNLRWRSGASTVWRRSTSDVKYRCNVEFKGDVEELVKEICKYTESQKSIELTIHNNFVYYN